MDTRSLRFFLAVARAKSIKLGAQILHLTQPNVTRTIQALEQELGVTLFVRSTKGLSLTPEGELLQKRAEDILELMDKTKTEISAMEAAGLVGDVYIASGETRALTPFVQTMIDLRKDHPGLRFHIVSGNAEEVTRRIDAGLADFGVVFDPTDVTPYEHIRLPWVERWGVLMRKDDSLAKQSSISAQDLTQRSLILSVQQQENNGLVAWFDTVYPNLDVVATYSLIYTPTMMVECGLGVAITFEHLVDTSINRELVFRPLFPELHANAYLIRQKGQILSPGAQCYYEALLSRLAQISKTSGHDNPL